jgi:hypothetical protein
MAHRVAPALVRGTRVAAALPAARGAGLTATPALAPSPLRRPLVTRASAASLRHSPASFAAAGLPALRRTGPVGVNM